jgi:hypothetical protein
MNFGDGATEANGYHTTGFNKFQTRTVKDVPGVSYLLIPRSDIRRRLPSHATANAIISPDHPHLA